MAFAPGGPALDLAADVRRRRRLLREELAHSGLDAVVLSSEPNFQYFSGYRTPSWANRARPMLLLARADGSCLAVVSEAEADRVESDGVDLEAIPYREPVASTDGGEAILEFIPAAVSAAAHGLRPARRLGLELSSHFQAGLPAAAMRQLALELGAEPVDAASILWRLRIRKSALEVDCLRRAADALERAYQTFAATAGAGLSERELHRLFLEAAAASGADWIGYVSIVVDSRGALLGGLGARRWERDRLLLVDAGLLVDGYWSDFWRIFVAGEPSQVQAAAYAEIFNSVRAEREAVAKEPRAADVARLVGRLLERGNGGVFGRVGHGIGLDLTEPPSLHCDDPTPIVAGMTLCVEPAGWFPEVGHLVAEETIVVTEGGCELISPAFPERLLPVGS